MAVIFGKLDCDPGVVSEEALQTIASGTQIFGLDEVYLRVSPFVAMGHQPQVTHPRSALETLPATNERGDIVCLDGRLDNHRDLCQVLDLKVDEIADSTIVLKSFERWGEACFERFVGDWSIALWSNADRSLYLSRDHAGTRTLFFDQTAGRIVWSTCLETFFVNGERYKLSQDFACRYLVGERAGNLTPYDSIRLVPAGHYLKYRRGRIEQKAHWSSLARDEIRYKNEEAYEEQLIELLVQSVDRRDDGSRSVLAHLSGGMDSCSIVCLSDQLRRQRGASSADLIDTLSLYDDSEPSWNEKPYFTEVERQRGKEGIHIAASVAVREISAPDPGYLWPGGDHRTDEAAERFESQLGVGAFRSILSGAGGDELMGGRPDPLPELADYLTSGRFDSFFQQAFRWCLPSRTPLIGQLSQVFKYCAQLYLMPSRANSIAPIWIRKNANAELPTLDRRRRIGLRPSAVHSSLVWETLLETLPHLGLQTRFRYEYRYPFLDRDLVEFLLRVPPTYLKKPGRRRYLMRKALEHVVPSIILERRRKAFLSRRPIAALQAERAAFETLFSNSILASSGFIDRRVLKNEFERATTAGDPLSASALLRTIAFESWLQGGLTRLRL